MQTVERIEDILENEQISIRRSRGLCRDVEYSSRQSFSTWSVPAHIEIFRKSFTTSRTGLGLITCKVTTRARRLRTVTPSKWSLGIVAAKSCDGGIKAAGKPGRLSLSLSSISTTHNPTLHVIAGRSFNLGTCRNLSTCGDVIGIEIVKTKVSTYRNLSTCGDITDIEIAKMKVSTCSNLHRCRNLGTCRNLSVPASCTANFHFRNLRARMLTGRVCAPHHSFTSLTERRSCFRSATAPRAQVLRGRICAMT